MRDYGSVHTRFWSHPDIQTLSDQAKLLALYLLTGPHTNMLGCFRLPMGYVCEDLRWGSETVSKRLGELFQMGFATHDSAHHWIFIHRFLEWNPIENPNQGKSIRRLFEQVPHKALFFKQLITILLAHAKHLEEPFRNGLQTLLQPFRNQEQEQDQDQDQDQKQDQEQGQEQEASGVQALRKTVIPTVSSMTTTHVSQPLLATTADHAMSSVIAISLQDNTEFFISPQHVEKWQLLYPAIDVMQVLHKIQRWNIANPNRRKNRSNILRHIVTWLAKENNHGGGNRVEPSTSRSSPIYERNRDVTHRWLNPSDVTVIDNPVIMPTLLNETQP